MSVDAVFDYLDFVVERHKVWGLRQEDAPGPWSSDPILQRNKFTNVFRVLDTGSQFLLRELLNEPGITAADALGRSFLYRMTNLPTAWQYSLRQRGRYPRVTDFGNDLATDWCALRDGGTQVFSGAYTIMPLPGVKGFDKVWEVVGMARRAFHPNFPGNVVDAFLQADSMQERFQVLKGIPAVGDFLAMQVLTDFGYSPFGHHQDEDEFVVAGPGARKGAKEIFPDQDALETIRWAHREVHALPDCPEVMGRKPSMMDIQNTLCEFSKYARFQRAPEPQRVFTGSPGVQEAPVFPTHWHHLI